MSDEIAKIRLLLEAAQRKLKELEKQAVGLRSEITAYEKVCAILSGQDLPGASASASASARSSSNEDGSNSRRSRGLSETWQKVVYWIGSQNAPPETEHIYAYTMQAGLEINRNTLRSQLSVYTTQGILRRVDGHYFVTERGLDMLQTKPSDEPAAEAEPERLSSLFSDVRTSEEKEVDLDDEIPF